MNSLASWMRGWSGEAVWTGGIAYFEEDDEVPFPSLIDAMRRCEHVCVEDGGELKIEGEINASAVVAVETKTKAEKMKFGSIFLLE